MTISRKLILTFLLVLTLLVLNLAITVFIVKRMERDVLRLALVEEPLENAALEMEIYTGESAIAVLNYIRGGDEGDLARMRDSERAFQQHAKEFQRLAETTHEQALGRKVDVLYQEFKNLGLEIMALSKRRVEELATFSKNVLEIDEVIVGRLLSTINRYSADAFPQLEAALEMEVNINKAFTAIEAYILVDDPGLREKIADSEAGFLRFAAQYRNTRLSAGEKKWLDVVDNKYAIAVEAGNEIIEITGRMREKIEMFKDDIQRIDQILDEEVQVYIHGKTERAAANAQRSSEIGFIIVLVAGLSGFVIASVAGWILYRGIVDGASQLSIGAVEFGQGNFDHRVEVRTKDELRVLADVFNDMAMTIQKMTDGLKQRVKERTQELENTNKELEAFAYSVSHDLRAPLRGMDGFSRALLDDYGEKLDEQGREYLHRVRNGAQRMGNLIDDILSLSHISSQSMTRRKVDLSVLAHEILDNLKTAEPARQVDVLVDGALEREGDPGLLRVMLENLIGNAWKFTSKLDIGRIEFGVTEVNGQITNFVRDNGVGFDMQYADKLFGVFQRLHSDNEFPGTGIGLATVKRVVNRHGGHIWVESEEGRGTTFYFTLQSNPTPSQEITK